MVHTREAFSSLDDLNSPNILLGYNSHTEIKGKGRIDINHGSFNNVFYVLGLVANIFSIYYMTHNGSPKKVVFTLNDVEISDILNRRVIAKGFVDNSSNVYKFTHFMSFSIPSSLLTHANESFKLCHERFIHINYKYVSIWVR